MQGIDGAKVERIMELTNVALNKNTVPGDKSAMVPGGIRMGKERTGVKEGEREGR